MTARNRPTAHVLRKHVAVIHTSGVFSLVERKVSNVLLYNAYADLVSADGREPRHSIPLPHMGKLIGWDDSKNLDSLKDVFRGLQKKTVEFNLMRDGNEEWESMPLLSYARIARGICTYGYVAELAQKLRDPEMFAAINIGIQQRFKGRYSLNLFENCTRYKGVHSTGWWDVETFRHLMGADAATYDDFKRLSSFVIKPAVTEVNTVSDIYLTPDYKRDGRKVIALRFVVEKNPHHQDQFDADLRDIELADIRTSETYKRLRDHGIGDRIAIAALHRDPEQARLAIEKAELKDQQGKIQTSTAAYIRKLIEDKADLGTCEYEKQKADKRQAEASKTLLNKLLSDYKTARTKTAIEALGPEQLQKFALEYLEKLPARKQVAAGRFDALKGKFTEPCADLDFRHSWLPRKVELPFDSAAFEAYVRELGHDPEALHSALDADT